VLENLVTAGGAENPITDHIIDRQLVGIDDHATGIPLYRHRTPLSNDLDLEQARFSRFVLGVN
jgi:hypothetical protein